MNFGQLAPALIGLLGVLIGAAATTGITYLGDHNRAKAEERGAERVVLAEVLSDDALINDHSSPGQLSDAAWVAERERLARSLSNNEWAWVAKYYRDLGKARRRSTARLAVLQDEGCTLRALNVGSYYSDLPPAQSHSNGPCTKKPPYTS